MIKFTVIITVEEYKEKLGQWKEYVKGLSIVESDLSIYQTSYEISFPNFEDWLLKKLRDDLNIMNIDEIHVIHSTEVTTKHL